MTQRSFQTALVAGGAGFVGSHLCDHLVAEGYRVICVDSLLTSTMENLSGLLREPRFTFVEQDIVDPLPRGMTVDFVFNLACAASPPLYQLDPIHTMMTSVVGTNNLLAFAGENGARLLQASTSEVYGDPLVHPQPESYFGNVNPVGPRACYDEGKRAAETLCFDYLRQGMADVRVARIFNTYGPRLRANDGRVISNMVTQALSGESITIYGDGSQTRSFCYVDDLVIGFMKLMLHDEPLPHAINLGNPDEYSIAEIAVKIRSMTNSQSAVVFRPLPQDDPTRRRPDIDVARSVLGWTPNVGLNEGLERTVDWFRSATPTMRQSEMDVGRKLLHLTADAGC
jgi:UDP-glucuronate decarboxylase